ncbi:MAG: hypothetical protein QNJ64_00210 [Crocosphaera sp.]|nr:hypothetical protein [Crocosphaera sp.]
MLKIYLKLLQKYRPSAGWTLAELMIAAGMTMMVLMGAGFGLVTLLQENKVANATGEMQQDVNRATEFISDEIRNAKIVEHFARGDDIQPSNLHRVEGYAPTFWRKYIQGKGSDAKVPILALKIEGVYERVVYYVDDVDTNDVWNGPGVIRRFGPSFKLDGTHSDEQKKDPSKWKSDALVDMIPTALEPGQKQCSNLPPDNELSNGYIATDTQGMEWYRLPPAEADVKGFFVCVREDKQLVQLNIKGTNVDQFKHLYGKEKENKDIFAKETRHTEKMQYNVNTMVHARSEVIGSDGQSLPLFSIIGGKIAFQETGRANLNVLYLDVPCVAQGLDPSAPVPTFDPNNIETYITVLDSEKGIAGKEGLVEGTNIGESVSVPANTQISAKMAEKSVCGVAGEKMVIEISNADLVKFATNDNSDHVTLNALIEDDLSQSKYSGIINQLERNNLIRSDGSNTYNFTLADNQILFFVEYETHEVTGIDANNMPILEPQTDGNYDDGIILIELTR